MSKHTHHQTKVEQRNNKEHGAAPFHFYPYEESKSMESKSSQTDRAVNDNAIELMAYLIHLEKGGSALDNWLEAEKSLR